MRGPRLRPAGDVASGPTKCHLQKRLFPVPSFSDSVILDLGPVSSVNPRTHPCCGGCLDYRSIRPKACHCGRSRRGGRRHDRTANGERVRASQPSAVKGSLGTTPNRSTRWGRRYRSDCISTTSPSRRPAPSAFRVTDSSELECEGRFSTALSPSAHIVGAWRPSKATGNILGGPRSAYVRVIVPARRPWATSLQCSRRGALRVGPDAAYT